MGILTTNDLDGANELRNVFHFPKSDKALLIFIRNPELGTCKKRLAAIIGDEKALAIYKILLQHTAAVTTPLKADKFVYYSEAIQTGDIWDEAIYSKRVQQGQDLGQRMEEAFAEVFSFGFEKAIIIGSDLYDINSNDIETAFNALETHDVVLGPAEDGGYYLLGMKKMKAGLFSNKKWGTATVLKDTLSDLQNNLYYLLPLKNDVDVYEDIEHIEAFRDFIIKD